jgi:hypothetical protein
LYTQEKAGGSIEANTTLAPKLQFSPFTRVPSTAIPQFIRESIDLDRVQQVESTSSAILPFALWFTRPVSLVRPMGNQLTRQHQEFEPCFNNS